MTLILKSSEAVNIKNLADVMPNPSLHLDFRSEIYSKDGQSLSDYSPLITVTRPTTLQGFSGAGSVIDLPLSTLKPVTSFSGEKGLPVTGRVLSNFFLNSHAPVTQQITISFELQYAYILQVVGNGEAKLSIAGVVIGTAKQDKPFVYNPTTAGSQVVTVEVSGNPYYVGLCASTSTAAPQVVVKTTTAIRAYGTTDARIEGSIINPLLSNGNGTIAFRHHIPEFIEISGYTKARLNTALVLLLANSEHVIISWQDYGLFDYSIRTKIGEVEHLKTLVGAMSQDNVYVLRLEPEIITAYCNGKLIGSVPRPTAEITGLLLGSGNVWSKPSENLIQELAVYSDVISDEQAKSLSSL